MEFNNYGNFTLVPYLNAKDMSNDGPKPPTRVQKAVVNHGFGVRAEVPIRDPKDHSNLRCLFRASSGIGGLQRQGCR